jgi:hypothetical protein
MTGIPEVTTRRFRSASDLAHELKKTTAQADVAPVKRPGGGGAETNGARMKRWREVQAKIKAELGIGQPSPSVEHPAPQSNNNDTRMISWRETQKRVKAEMGIGQRN